MRDLPEVIETERGPTVVGAGAGLLEELLQVLEAELTSAGAPCEDFRPGIAESGLRKAFSDVGLGLPDEVAVLFGWHDGRLPNRSDIVPRFPFETSAGNIRTYIEYQAVFNEILATERPPPGDTSDYDWGAGAGWLRLWPDMYTWAVDCTGDQQSPPLLRNTHELFYADEPPPTQLASLCTPITWIVEGIRAGAHVWSAESQRWELNWEHLPPLQFKYGFV